MNTRGSGGITPSFLTLALDRGEWSASGPGLLTPGEGAPCTHCIGGWVGIGVALDAVEYRKILASAGNLTPAIQSLVHCYSY
jgi:hypothetical protein